MSKKRSDIVQDQIEREQRRELLGTGEIYRDGLSIREAEVVFRSVMQGIADQKTTEEYLRGNTGSDVTIDGVLNLSTNEFWVMLERSPDLEENKKRAEARIILRKKKSEDYFECRTLNCLNMMKFSQCSVGGKQSYPNCKQYEPRYPEDPKKQLGEGEAERAPSRLYRYIITITPNGTR